MFGCKTINTATGMKTVRACRVNFCGKMIRVSARRNCAGNRAGSSMPRMTLRVIATAERSEISRMSRFPRTCECEIHPFVLTLGVKTLFRVFHNQRCRQSGREIIKHSCFRQITKKKKKKDTQISPFVSESEREKNESTNHGSGACNVEVLHSRLLNGAHTFSRIKLQRFFCCQHR